MREITEFFDEFLSYTSVFPDNFTADGKFYRYGEKKRFWAVGSEVSGNIFIHYGDWKTGEQRVWKSFEDSEITDSKRKYLESKFKENQERVKKEKAKRAKQVAEEQILTWQKVPEFSSVHPYMESKGFYENFVARSDGQRLLIPMMRGDDFRGIQYIYDGGDGFVKMFPSGVAKQGSYCQVSDDLKGTVLVCEGYATACAVHVAMPKFSVVCAFDAGNLFSVCQFLLDQSGVESIIICADHDESHTGERAAQKCRDELKKVSFIIPGGEYGDFNDLFQREGKESVSRVISRHLASDHRWPSLVNGFTFITDKGRVIRFCDELIEFFKHNMKASFVAEERRWFKWNGKYHEEITDHEVRLFAQTWYAGDVKEGERREFQQRAEIKCLVPLDFMHKKTNGLINFKNGTFDIKSGKLLDHSPRYGFRYMIPHNWTGETDCPTWDNLMDLVFCGNKDLIDVFEKFAGLCLSGEGHENFQEMLILSGGGANGKSTLIHALQKLIGDNYSAVSMNNVTGNRFSISSLRGSLVNFSEEEPPNSFKESGLIKKLTGNSPIYGEEKGKPGFHFTNNSRLIVTYNELPDFKDKSAGWRRRIMILPCEANLLKNPEKKIQNVIQKVEAESSAIICRLVSKYMELKKYGSFRKTDEMEREFDQVMMESDPVLMWFKDRVEIVDNSNVSTQRLYNDFVNYSGEKHISKIEFSRNLKEHICSQIGVSTKNFDQPGLIFDDRTRQRCRGYSVLKLKS